MTGFKDDAERAALEPTSGDVVAYPVGLRDGSDETAEIDDVSLLYFAPTKILPVVLPALLIVAIGAVGDIVSPFAVRIDATNLRLVVLILAALTIVFGLSYATSGYRAYLTSTKADVKCFMEFQIVGFWGLSVCFLVGGIISRFWSLTLFCLFVSQSLAFIYANRRGSPGSSLERVFTRLRPAFIGECVFAIVAAPLAAVIALGFPLSEDSNDRFIAYALIIPTMAIIVLILLVRARRYAQQ